VDAHVLVVRAQVQVLDVEPAQESATGRVIQRLITQ
jgi:hypothetical protein